MRLALVALSLAFTACCSRASSRGALQHGKPRLIEKFSMRSFFIHNSVLVHASDIQRGIVVSVGRIRKAGAHRVSHIVGAEQHICSFGSHKNYTAPSALFLLAMSWIGSTRNTHIPSLDPMRQKRSKLIPDLSISKAACLLNCLCLLLVVSQLLSARLQNRLVNQQADLSLSAPPEHRYVEGEPEIWALGPRYGDEQQKLAPMLDSHSTTQLKALCARCLYRTLTNYVDVHFMGRSTIVRTGDIPAMWLRDSAVQMASYFPRLLKRPGIKQVLEGAIRSQAYFILQDPWANAYNPKYVPVSSLSKYDRQLGRGGWVWTRNFELDSVAYFLNFLWNYHQTPGVWKPEDLLTESVVHDAVITLLNLLLIEQHHEERSPYRLVAKVLLGNDQLSRHLNMMSKLAYGWFTKVMRQCTVWNPREGA